MLIRNFRSRHEVVFLLFPGPSVFSQSGGASWLAAKCTEARRRNLVADFRTEGRINVAAPLRRGDIMRTMKADKGPGRECYIGTDCYLALARMVQEAVDTCFVAFEKLANVHFRLDSDEMESMNAIAMADIAILSPSFFSYLPALLSRQIRILRSPFWHDIPNSPEWVQVDCDPVASPGPIADRIRKALEWRNLRMGGQGERP